MIKKVGFDKEAPKYSFMRYSLTAVKLSLIDAVIRAFDFSGRTSRAPYWIATTIFGLCAVFSLASVTWSLNWDLGIAPELVQDSFIILVCIFLFPLISLFIRRNHDLNDSIWDVFNPFKNNGFLNKTLFDPGDPKPNRFGSPHILW